MKTKKEYIAEKMAEYKQLKKANKIALKLEKKIADIRSRGYKIIVLGATVKVTVPKNN